jgi:uncharacterized protein YcfL
MISSKTTKLLILAAVTLSLTTACSSNKKSEDVAEQALIEQTQDLMADTTETENSESTYENNMKADESDLGASSSGLGH